MSQTPTEQQPKPTGPRHRAQPTRATLDREKFKLLGGGDFPARKLAPRHRAEPTGERPANRS